MKCLIIASGQGKRLASLCNSKPLVSLLGLPLIERVILTARQSGLTDFYIVVGYHGDKIKAALNDFNKENRINITYLTNNEWEKGNGLSVLKARGVLKEKFILLMSDHIFDTRILSELQKEKIADDEVLLAVDYQTDANPLVNINDVTKVNVDSAKHISDIGKTIERYNAYDTGIFLCAPSIFKAIEESVARKDDSSLSGAIRVLAEKKKARAFDIKNGYWVDIDDEKSLKQAQTLLLANLKKPTDGPISRYLNRPISTRLSRYLLKTNITPNLISWISFILSITATLFFFLGNYLTLVIGGILVQISSIIDGCDGEIARLKFKETDFGGWFDAVLDRYADAFVILGLTYYFYSFNPTNFLGVLMGFLALIGSFMNSYTADKYAGYVKRKLGPKVYYWRLGRDVRMFIIFIGALINQVFLTLLVIAFLTNLENVRRIWILSKAPGIEGLKKKIKEIIKNSTVAEDPIHSQNTLEWILKLTPHPDESLKIAALGHDIERAMEENKIKRQDFENYDGFKVAHADNSTKILEKLMVDYKLPKNLIEEVCSLVRIHEIGGNAKVNILNEADSLSFFEVNLPYYFQHNDVAEVKNRISWGYQRLSAEGKKMIAQFTYQSKELRELVTDCIKKK